MKNQITCPNCHTEINVENALTEQVKSTLDKDYLRKKKELEEEFQSKEVQLKAEKGKLDEQEKKQDERLAQLLKEKEPELRKNLEKRVSEDYEVRLTAITDDLNEKKEKLRKAEKVELELRKREETLNERMKNLELEAKRQVDAERKKIEEGVRKQVETDTQMKMEEKEMLISNLKEQLDDMQRRMEQGSMQTQGEVQEIALESLLSVSFPADIIEEVKKGANGADCIQKVRNSFGKECGSIIFESKRTKGFSQGWIEKLKEDQRKANADVAVIVTETMPKDMDQFGLKDDVWICTFQEVRALATVLREGILRVDEVSAVQENQGEKMSMLYEYLTSPEFTRQVKAVVSGFAAMKESISKQRRTMEKTWTEQESRIEMMLKNTIGIYGRVKGIAGSAVSDIEELDLKDEPLPLNQGN